ncbi:MAG: PAS domain S-box protein [Candidatus Lokiarchaeota archaeon]|nr:PAS domain S-box protein [Candidatus Lokiarchaeota archaeon]
MSLAKMLIKSPKKLKSFLNTIPIPIYAWQILRNNLFLIDYNSAAYVETKGEIKNNLGSIASEFYKDNIDILDVLKECTDKSPSISKEIKYFCSISNEVKSLLIKTDFIPPDLVFVYKEDITRKRHLEDQLKESQGMLRDANKKLRQRVEEKTKKLKESERQYRLISENANDILIMVNETYETEYVNEQALKNLLGYSKEEVIGHSGLEFIHPDDIKTALLSVKKGIEKGQGVTEIRYRHKEGYYVWMEATGKTFTEEMGELKGIVVLRDITKRRSIELELKNSEEKYRLISENANDILLLTNEKYEIEYVNSQALQKLLGYSEKEVIGRFGLDFIHPDDVEKTIHSLKKGIEEGQGLIEIRARHKKGHFIWIEATGKTFNDDMGVLKGTIVLRDITERKSIGLALKESEEKYRLITENTHDLIGVVNQKFKYEYINKKPHLNILGYKSNDLIGKSAWRLIHPDDISNFITVLKDKEKYNEIILDFRIKHKNGDWIWIRFKGSMFKTENNEEKILLVSRDITTRKKAELKLMESEEKYRHLFEKSPYMIILINEKGDIIDFNQNTLKYLIDISKNDLIGRNFLDLNFIPLMHMKKLKNIYKDLFRKGFSEPFEFQMDILNKNLIDPNLKWIEVQTAMVKVGDANLIQMIIQDISERKSWEEKIRESEEKFRKFFEESQDGVILTDENGIIIKWNKGQERIFGIKKTDIIGHPICDAFFMQIPEEQKTAETYELLQSTIENFFKTEKAPWLNKLEEVDIQKADGTYQCIQQLPFSIKTSKGCMLGSINRDITEDKIAEQKLLESEEKYHAAYDQADFYKNLFTHDISNILFVINGSSQLCSIFLEDPEKAKEVKVNLNRIRDQVVRAKLLIKNVRRMSEINTNNPLLKSIDICKLLTKCIKYINESYEEKSVEISVTSSSKQFFVQANDLILDIFENLLINAIKHNQNSIKKIIINVAKEEKDGVQFLKMEFIDNGIGITDERKEIIFQKGHKKDEYTKGMGIGLTLVKIIIDSYNGFIWVEDKVSGDHSKGSNFIILIPLVSLEN